MIKKPSAAAVSKKDDSVSGAAGAAAPPFIPDDYVDGYRKAALVDAARAANYVEHTAMGDPVADALVARLAEFSVKEAEALLTAAIDDPDAPLLRDSPPEIMAFVEDLATEPDWLDRASFDLATRMFYRNTYLGLAAMLGGVLVEGFSTNIAKSFFITGRMRDQGVRRLRQNNRHLMEILLPGGLISRGDGWKLSVRIRVVHAQVRRLLTESDDWDHEAWGEPISAAHVAFALSAFSSRMLDHMVSLGAKITPPERVSFMAVWRYTGHLMGVPPTILFVDEADAKEMFRIGNLCEPRNTAESVVLANSLLNSGPLVAGVTEPEERRNLARYVFKLSRALIGNSLASSLNYPQGRAFGVLPWFRLQQRYHHLMENAFPVFAKQTQYSTFKGMLDASALDELGISYKLPDNVHAEKSADW